MDIKEVAKMGGDATLKAHGREFFSRIRKERKVYGKRIVVTCATLGCGAKVERFRKSKVPYRCYNCRREQMKKVALKHKHARTNSY